MAACREGLLREDLLDSIVSNSSGAGFNLLSSIFKDKHVELRTSSIKESSSFIVDASEGLGLSSSDLNLADCLLTQCL